MRALRLLPVLLACIFLPPAFALAASDPGSGPAISVPKDLSRTNGPLPKPNWIDQTAEDVHRKSRGCIECHAGIEPMHTSSSVMLGCTDCHGGNATPALTQRKAH